MSGVLAGLKVEMRYLQRDNTEQAIKTRELEQQYQAQSAKVNQLESLKQQYQEQAAKLAEQAAKLAEQAAKLAEQAAELLTIKARANTTENHVNTLTREGEEQAAELLTIKARANTTENHVNTLTREGEVKRVAFSASLVVSGSETIGPFNAHTNLIFRNVVTNVGNAYNPNTGFFTAPVRAAYHFEFYLHGNGHPSYGTGAVLVKNGDHVLISHERQTSGSVNPAHGVTLLLEVGDVVFLRQWINSRIYDDHYHYTTFSGQLLFTL
ncbi:complement C1q-like protein 2 [Cololabis saira]|uniref:complement C1q-like protein 2 n=1 Tax=Cololabis saira TaxID=129043 RepID=UPI002AD2C7F1|nr:complement C1q-like protein 2 [Cololabis saira]